MLTPLDPGSPLAILLTEWGPPFVTIVIGGLFASILFPRWQDIWTRTRAASQRRLDLTQDIASAFEKYVTSWRRLVDIAGLARERPLTEAEQAQLQSFVAHRNAARDTLLDRCALGQLYFSDKGCALIDSFACWDTAQAAKRLEELPDMEEWRKWKARVMVQLRSELGMRRRR